MESSIDINELNSGLFGYTQNQVNVKVADLYNITVAEGDANDDGILDDSIQIFAFCRLC
jgi:hypothetical protein